MMFHIFLDCLSDNVQGISLPADYLPHLVVRDQSLICYGGNVLLIISVHKVRMDLTQCLDGRPGELELLGYLIYLFHDC